MLDHSKISKKVKFLFYMLKIYNIGIAIITETWLDKRLQILNSNYRWYQTKKIIEEFAILANYNLKIKEEVCDEFDGCFKLISLRANEKLNVLY